MTEETTPTQQDQNVQCERCGSFEAIEFAGQFLCADCITLAGCGCAGHGDQAEE